MKITNKYNLPKQLVSAVEREYKPTHNRFSVTTLLKGTKEIILSRRYGDEVEKDVSDMVWLLFGTAFHSVVENAESDADEIKEELFVHTFEDIGMSISGKMDLYSPKTQTVTDWKTASVNKVLFNDWEDYRKQCLMYCYLLRMNGYQACNGQIVAFLKDWNKRKAKIERDYPKHPIHIEKWHFKEDEFIEIESFIKDKLYEIKEMMNLDDYDIPECKECERWAKPTTYAVMKNGNKRALRVFESHEDAQRYLEEKKEPKTYIEVRKGEDVKCLDYCDYCNRCNYFRRRYLSDAQ